MRYVSLTQKLFQNANIAFSQAIFKRPFFHWLTVIANRVDEDRVEQVGPDRACSEWLLRNGAAVKWKNITEYLSDYNLLPNEDEQWYIQAVDATNSDIHTVGFHHFKNCKHIEEIKLVGCRQVADDAMRILSLYLKDSLLDLTVINCKNITDEGLLHLSQLSNLKNLKLGEFPFVKNEDEVISNLSKALPKCEISYRSLVKK